MLLRNAHLSDLFMVRFPWSKLNGPFFNGPLLNEWCGIIFKNLNLKDASIEGYCGNNIVAHHFCS